MYTPLIVLIAVSVISANPVCPPTDSFPPTFFSHATSCSHFYECSHGVPYLMECPDGLDFNIRLGLCDWPEQAGCRSTIDVPKTAE